MKKIIVCVLTTYLILFCGGRRRLHLSFVFCENLNETKNSKDSLIECGDFFLKLSTVSRPSVLVLS